MEELAEHGLALDGSQPWHRVTIAELDYAMRPRVHERRVPSFGALIGPTTDQAEWRAHSQLDIALRPVGDLSLPDARRYADGMSSWLLRPLDGGDQWAVFDRPAGSERDLVVLAEAFGASIVQRHPQGTVRLVGSFGVMRWDGLDWQHEALVANWLDLVGTCGVIGHPSVLETLLEFAVHDLGALGIGATLVYRPDFSLATSFDERMPAPPPLQVSRPADLAPLRHALAQVDGAVLFDETGTLRHIGVRLVPTAGAEADVDGYRGTRHTSARRYSYDDPSAVVIVVSEDGPVTVLCGGEVLGTSARVRKLGLSD